MSNKFEEMTTLEWYNDQLNVLRTMPETDPDIDVVGLIQFLEEKREYIITRAEYWLMMIMKELIHISITPLKEDRIRWHWRIQNLITSLVGVSVSVDVKSDLKPMIEPKWVEMYKQAISMIPKDDSLHFDCISSTPPWTIDDLTDLTNADDLIEKTCKAFNVPYYLVSDIPY